MAPSASQLHVPIAQKIRAFERISVVVISNPTRANLRILKKRPSSAVNTINVHMGQDIQEQIK